MKNANSSIKHVQNTLARSILAFRGVFPRHGDGALVVGEHRCMIVPADHYVAMLGE